MAPAYDAPDSCDMPFAALGSLFRYVASKNLGMTSLKNTVASLGSICVLLTLMACSTVPDDKDPPEGVASAPQILDGLFPPVLPLGAAADWQYYLFPGKRATQYTYQSVDGRHAVAAKAQASASMLRQRLRVEPSALGSINFSWKVPQLIPGADLTRRETHDSPVRLVLVFEGDRTTFSIKNSMLSELARSLTGEEMPYATLMYAWCNECRAGEVMINPRTDRIREIPLESGAAHLGQWRDYERDVRADYLKAFGEAPGALLGVGLMTDTDNTGENTTAWYGPVSLTAPKR